MSNRIGENILLKYDRICQINKELDELEFEDKLDEVRDRALTTLRSIEHELYINELNKSRYNSWAKLTDLLTPIQIARYYIYKFKDNPDVHLSETKISALIYFLQGYYLSDETHRPLFSEPIYNRDNFPYIKTFSDDFKEYLKNGKSKAYSGRPLPKQTIYQIKKLDKFLDEIWDIVGRSDDWHIKNWMAETTPIKDTKSGDIIHLREMYLYFNSLYTHVD